MKKNYYLFLTLFAFYFTAMLVYAQENWITLFQDNFDKNNTDNWQLDTGWQIGEDGGNYILNGSDHTWANLNNTYNWSDYKFKIRVKLISGGVHLNYRISDKGRYFIGFHEGGLYLNKTESWVTHHNLISDNIPHSLNTWYKIEIVGIHGDLKVYVNKTLRLEYTDCSPLFEGKIALETLDNSSVCVDDIEIIGKFPAFLSAYTWHRTGGPIGGLGYDVRIHPSNPKIMFVTDNPSGVNKSYDGGVTWRQRNNGITVRTGPSLDGIPVFSLTIDPNNPDIVWAGTQNVKGIFKSNDAGETWTKRIMAFQKEMKSVSVILGYIPKTLILYSPEQKFLQVYWALNLTEQKGKSTRQKTADKSGFVCGKEIIWQGLFSLIRPIRIQCILLPAFLTERHTIFQALVY